MPSRGTRPNRRPSAVMASSQPAQRAFLEKLPETKDVAHDIMAGNMKLVVSSSSGVCKVGTSSASMIVYSTIVAVVACNNRNGVGILRTRYCSKMLNMCIDRCTICSRSPEGG